MKVFVTGHKGLLGGHIWDHLTGLGWHLVGYDRKEDGQDEIHNVDRMAEKMAGCDAAIHLAGIPHPLGHLSRADYIRENIEGSVAVAKAAKQAGVPRFVYCSSGSVNGFNAGLDTKAGALTEDDHVPVDNAWAAGDYQASKLLAEEGIKKIKFPKGALALRVDGPGELNQGGVHRGWQCPWGMLVNAFQQAVTVSVPRYAFIPVNVGYADEGKVDFSQMDKVLGLNADGVISRTVGVLG